VFITGTLTAFFTACVIASMSFELRAMDIPMPLSGTPMGQDRFSSMKSTPISSVLLASLAQLSGSASVMMLAPSLASFFLATGRTLAISFSHHSTGYSEISSVLARPAI